MVDGETRLAGLRMAIAAVAIALFFFVNSDGQERVVLEEIVLNVSAQDWQARPVAELKEDDLVILENGRPHRPNSIRKLLPSVLIAMDTGGDQRQRKNITTTRKAAERLATTLPKGTHFSVLQFHDRAEVLAEWTNDCNETIRTINNRTTFGRRSTFIAALDAAVAFFADAPTDDRHIVFVTDGLDSVADDEQKMQAIRRAWASGIAIHILSYTQIEFEALKPQARIWREGEPNPRRVPDEVKEALIASLPLPRSAAIDFIERVYPPRLLSILTDVPFIGSKRSQLRDLSAGQVRLSALAEYSGGASFMPESLEELEEKSAAIASIIGSNFIITYEPRRPIAEAEDGEVRHIEVSSRNPDIRVHGNRRLVVFTADR